jgi:hypothetical protein
VFDVSNNRYTNSAVWKNSGAVKASEGITCGDIGAVITKIF